MADRVKLIERIAARGRRKLEKRNARIAAQEEKDRRHPVPVEIAPDDAKRAKLARREERQEILRARALRAARRGPPDAQEVLAKQARRAKAAERRAYRKQIALERVASTPAPPSDKRADALHSKARGAAVRAAAVLSRIETISGIKRAPPLPYAPVKTPRRMLSEEEWAAKREAEINAVEAIFAQRRAKDAAKRLPPLPY